MSAHIFFFIEKNGPIPKGLHADHLCRIRACVNPDHIELVTPAENTRRGSNTKLSRDDVRSIRTLRIAGWGAKDIANAYGISDGMVCHIAKDRKWVGV
jgi:hypothetical protein